MPDQHHHATVLIAGGSIAGLTLANALEQLGVDYLVLEKHKQIAPDIGASICIFPNGFRVLDQLGCYGRIKEMAQGADPFASVIMRNCKGQAIIDVPGASQQIDQRMGYAPIFMERQMIIQALHDNLKDQSTIRTGKGVVEVHLTAQGVEVVTSDGTSYTGDVLIGADGIHSAVRSQMWKLAAEQQPASFQLPENTDVPVSYCCMFGISSPGHRSPHDQTQHIQGQNHSYLISTGPENVQYWCLFKKLDVPAQALQDGIPRYTDAERDTMAESHAADPLSETLTFGDLYRAKRVATLQALPEVVFDKWHYGRIMTIGDAAHKINPIGGQGGNSAIEDAACLANQLCHLSRADETKQGWKETEIEAAFSKVRALRYGRVKNLIRKSHYMQRVQAMDSRAMRLIASRVMPFIGGKRILNSLCNDSKGAIVLEFLPLLPKGSVAHSSETECLKNSGLWAMTAVATFFTLLVAWQVAPSFHGNITTALDQAFPA